MRNLQFTNDNYLSDWSPTVPEKSAKEDPHVKKDDMTDRDNLNVLCSQLILRLEIYV